MWTEVNLIIFFSSYITNVQQSISSTVEWREKYGRSMFFAKNHRNFNVNLTYLQGKNLDILCQKVLHLQDFFIFYMA